MAWLIQVDGLLMDAYLLPRKSQEGAFRRGLIPYILGEQPTEGEQETT